jgi:hypothetical protein
MRGGTASSKSRIIVAMVIRQKKSQPWNVSDEKAIQRLEKNIIVRPSESL